MKLFREPLDEEEYIAKIRKSVSSVDRYGYWMAAFYLSLLIVIGWSFSQFVLRMIGMLNPPVPAPNGAAPNVNAWVWSGFTIGIVLGFGFMKCAHNIITAMMLPFTGMRTEKLLLKYHDQREDSEQEAFVEQPERTPFQMSVAEPGLSA